MSELHAGALGRDRPADGFAKVLGGRGHISINKAVPVVCLLHQVCLCGVFLWSACIKLGEIPGSGEALAERLKYSSNFV